MKIFIRAYYRTKWWIMFDVLKRYSPEGWPPKKWVSYRFTYSVQGSPVWNAETTANIWTKESNNYMQTPQERETSSRIALYWFTTQWHVRDFVASLLAGIARWIAP